MNTLLMGLLLLASFSCANTTKKNESSSPEVARTASQAEITTCQELINTTLQKAVYDDGLQFRFVEDEQQALKFMSQFDIQKLNLADRQIETNTIRSECKFREVSEVDKCEFAFPVYDYFNGLLYGLKNYDWSKTTKQKGTQQLLTYSKTISQRQTSLLDTSMALVLVNRLAEENSQFKKHRHDLRTIRKEMDKAEETLKDDYLRRSASGITCKDMIALLDAEEKQVKRFGESFLTVLRKM